MSLLDTKENKISSLKEVCSIEIFLMYLRRGALIPLYLFSDGDHPKKKSYVIQSRKNH